MAMRTVLDGNSIYESESAKSLLEDNNIPCFISNENLGTLYGSPMSLGGFKVMVDEDDYDRALELIDVFVRSKEDVELISEACPNCGGTDIEKEEKSPWFSVVLSVFLFGIATPKKVSRYRCRGCGKRWRPQKR